MKKNYLFFIAVLTALMVKAQCGPSYSDNSNYDSAGNSVGISFTTDIACGGTLTSITFNSGFSASSNSIATVRLYEGSGLSGNLLAELPNIDVTSTSTFDFSALMISMATASQYTVMVSDFTLPTTTGRGFNTPWYPPYTGGSLYMNDVERPGEHLAFSIEIQENTNVSPNLTFPDTWEFRGMNASTTGTLFTAPGPNPAGLDIAVIPTVNGRLSSPVLVDLDADGDLDMVSGSQDVTGGLFYYENTGSTTTPNWVQTALPTLDAVGFAPGSNNETKCQFVDIDDDGDYDLFYGSKNDAVGNNFNDIHYYENTGTATVPNFVLSTIPGILNQNVANFPSFAFVDLDNDTDYEMVTMGSDSLTYFLNTGTKSVPIFERKFHLENPWDMNSGTGILDRNWANGDVLATIPNFQDVDNDGDYDMLFGVDGGTFKWIENNGTVTMPDYGTYTYQNLTGDLEFFDFGQFSTISFGDVTGDGVLDAVMGSFNPGYFAWFEGVSNTLDIKNQDFISVKVFPNPTSGLVTISTEVSHVTIFDVTGKKVKETNKSSFNVEALSNGVYFLKIETKSGQNITKRLLKN